MKPLFVPPTKYFKQFFSKRKLSFAMKASFFVFLLLLFMGINFGTFLSATLKSITKDYDTLSFYPGNYSLSEENPDYSTAWWNASFALGEPDLSEDDSLLYFSDTNSAFYSGGDYTFQLNSFSLPIATDDINEDDDQAVEVVDINDTEVDSQGDDLESEEEIENNNINLDNEEAIGEDNNNQEEIIDEETENEDVIFDEEDELEEQMPGDEIIDEDPVQEEGNNLVDGEDAVVEDEIEVDDDIDTGEVRGAVEVMEDTDTEQEVEIIESNDLEDLSSIFKFSNYAQAQSENESRWEAYGEFKKAYLNLSLAYTSRRAFSDDNEEILNNIEEENNLLENAEEVDNTSGEETGADGEETFEEDNTEAENEDENISEEENDIIENGETENEEDTSVSDEQDEEQEEGDGEEVIQDDEEEEIQTDIEDEELEESINDSTEGDDVNEAGDDVSLFDFVKNANAQGLDEEMINIWYSVDVIEEKIGSTTIEKNIHWKKIKTIRADNFSNALNGGYLHLEAGLINDWSNIDNLAVKLEGVAGLDEEFVFYLDALWVDVDYLRADNAPEPEEDKIKRWEDSLELISGQDVVDINQTGEFEFRYTKNSQKVLESLGEFFGFVNYWKDVDLQISLVDSSGEEFKTPISIIFEDDGRFSFELPEIESSFAPGKYKLVFNIIDSSGDTEEEIVLDREFSWGVLAFNTDKTVYFPEEDAYLQMAVLDDYGHTICDAELSIEITNPAGDLFELSTEENEIFVSEECGPKSVTNKPDYYTHYQLGEAGNYEIKIIAKTKNGVREAESEIEVRENQALDISRKSATRIFPKQNYIMEISIKAQVDYLGEIKEYIPSGFKLLSENIQLVNNSERDPFSNDYKFEILEGREINTLLWQGVDLQAGDELIIKYTYDAPDISPEFYLLGPMQTDIFSETRKWQIASDAISKRVKTVMFMAGTYNGTATAGANTNTNNTFSTFNFRLAETGVEIKNAYIMFETMYEAYTSNSVYTGYNLAFDTCVESCTADAFSGTNRVLQDDNSTLSYNETESNQIRLLFDVTSEAQLAAYVGGGEELEAQVGYRLEKSVTESSIANAKAVLYVTYLYDTDSENITNTVSYPLDSTSGSDSGTRMSSIGSCTRNNDCPIFDYKMDIPEWSGLATSTNRLSQWFRTYGANDLNNANDIDPNINIQNYDVDSETFHHEAFNSGTQGNFPAMYFPDWTNSGYAEGVSQQLEMYFNEGTNYVVGGEVFETYIASSSASTKTRTVRFPMGVISNGGSTATASTSVDVYFPENGSGTGNVSIKSAYFRVITHNQNSATLSTTISSKVGNNSTSGDYVYNYNGGGSVIKPSHNIIHIIPSVDYSELGDANASTPKEVVINATQNATTYGGISAELVITYIYTDESTGYLSSVNLYGGQSNVAPTISTSLSTANSVLPEPSGKTILAAGLLSSYLNSDSGGTVGAGTIFLLDANLAVSSPSCTPAYRAEPDDINSFSEFYKDVSLAMNTTNNQTYSACYADDESLTSTDGAKMGGQFIYTYQWDNTPPTGTFNSLEHRLDGSEVADISIEINDADGHEVKAKLEYEATSTCAFSSPLDPSLDETDENITADFGDPQIENDNIYQIGTDAAPIITASGTNSVFFDWQLPQNVEATYCLRLTANDGMTDQITPATSTIYIDTLKPTTPGALSLYSRTGTSLTLGFGATSTETNFSEYKVFYKVYDGTDPDENDSVFASSTDTNLGNILFNGVTTTTINSLTEKTTYSLALWVYDNYGNRASSTRVDIYTNDAPSSSFNSTVQRTDGSGVVDISLEVDDANNDDANVLRLDYVLGTSCDFTSPLDPTLDETQANIQADFGAPSIENDNIYQVATSGAYILTSPGSNTIEFDWLGKIDQSSADGMYCLRAIVNDSYDDQKILATSTLILDNVNPSISGDLNINSLGLDSITLSLPTLNPATDTNEPTTNAYKIFYKEGTNGVSESDTEYDNTIFNAYDFSGATSTTITGLDPDTDYVINIWAYDTFGNKISATEVSAKTNSTLVNESLSFTNATSTNILLLDGSTEWNFQAVVSETDGWYALNEVELGLADLADDSSTFDDIRFKWSQSLQSFSEIGVDTNSAVTLSTNSTSTCALNTCTVNFKVVFEKSFASSSIDYEAELVSTNDSAKQVEDSYLDFYQGRYIELEQIHYRWRNDDGGE